MAILLSFLLISSGLSTAATSAESGAQDPLPTVVVESDDTVIRRSCTLVVPEGLVIEDVAGDGVVQVRGDGLVIEFAPGSVLRGAPPDTPWDALSGIGIRIDGAERLRLRGARVHGFRVGVHASQADGLRVEGADLSDNFRQRLRSTPLAEAGEDWLWPHANDGGEWRAQYGAALYVERTRDARIRGVHVRRGQNGIVLDRVRNSQVYDNDCSFLSGWGLAMWRSSGNLVSRNAFDFCIRGYSHGVYNRGQDSAGILCFEQCNDNVFVENSATHGGDGFFGFAGREALGEDGEHEASWYERRGNRGNLLLRNDFSYAAAHGIEMTFSFDNRFVENRVVGNAICGVWGGYSQDTWILRNEFAANGDAGYGLERGGVNIEHGRGNRILDNDFRGNRCGVHLWWDEEGDFLERPWGQANGSASEDNLVAGNRFDGETLAFHFRGPSRAALAANTVTGCAEELRTEEGVSLTQSEGRPAFPEPDLTAVAVGERRPLGARAALAGREHIVMTEWGPWDHQEPLLRLEEREAGRHVYRLLPESLPILAVAQSAATQDVEHAIQAGNRVVVRATRAGVRPYAATLATPNGSYEIQGTLLGAEWTVVAFPWTVDPREDEAGWRKESAGEGAVSGTCAWPRFHFDHGGPSQLGLVAAWTEAALPSDHFGTLARTTLELPGGAWRVRVLSDDGVRLWADGELLIDHWSWHAPTWDEAPPLVLEESREVELVLEHFEIDGYAKLVLEIEPLAAD